MTLLSPIYLRNINATHIMFVNNDFDSNIGTYGGAILIDNTPSPDSSESNSDSSPFISFQKNRFTRNMAYIEGNSLFIRGASDTKGLLSVDIDECVFKYNYGINVAFGSAVSIHGN
jgi:hypothetical protein